MTIGENFSTKTEDIRVLRWGSLSNAKTYKRGRTRKLKLINRLLEWTVSNATSGHQLKG